MQLVTRDICSTDACYGRLRELIMDARLLPNTHHLELALSERLFIEPEDIHDAALRLQDEGLVRTEPSGGFWITPIAINDIADTCEQISRLEASAAQLAAENGTSPLDLATLQDAIVTMDDALYREDLTQWARAEHHFQRSLVQCSKQSTLIAAALQLSEPVHRAHMVTLPLRPPPFDSVYQHTMLVDAIRVGAGAKARDMHMQHWRSTTATIVGALREHGLHRVSIFPRREDSWI